MILDRILARVAKHLPVRRIYADDPGNIYLERYYLFGREPKYFDTPVRVRLGWLPWIFFLHHFRRSDKDRELHSHPFGTSFSLILTGGYVETRARPRNVDLPVPTIERRIGPLTINVIRSNDYHRVTLLDEQRGAWTLFVAGRKVSSWGFLDLDTGEHVPWREFVQRREGVSE